MRKSILESLMRAHLRTFPPITKNGNGMIGDIKRTTIALLMNMVGGKNVRILVKEIVNEWTDKQAS